MNEIKTPTTYLVENCIMPFCKGCGHSHIVRKLDEAMVRLNLDPKNINLVSDIGCIGLVDSLFKTPHTVHTTHGRSTAFATGIELADCILFDSKLKTIVLIGDGGSMIGFLHLVQAALLNVDVTVILANNFLFGMTGGQNSSASPIDFITPTTPNGNIVPPLDMCKMMIDSHAGFVARKISTDKDLADVIFKAIAHPGFALVEIIELCTEYATPFNKLTGKALQEIVNKNGQELGILIEKQERNEFGVVYSSKFPKKIISETEKVSESANRIYENNLKRKIGIILAGSAGGKVQSAARMFCEAAVLANLKCTQKNDNPVTQGSGFSLSEVCIGPTEIFYTGIDDPDVVIIVSQDGIRELQSKKIFSTLSSSCVVFVDESLELPETNANVYRLPFSKMCKPNKMAASALLGYISASDIFPVEAFTELFKIKFRSEEEFFPKEFIEKIKSINFNADYINEKN
ncbi:MAG: thiamine pyrophosphate-dependent enzyme [Bacteroidota bacterium]